MAVLLFSTRSNRLARSFRTWQVTYDLVDSRDLGLENRDGVSDRRLLGVGDSRGAEGALLQGSELLVLAHFAENFRKHPLIIINLYTIVDQI